MASAFDTGRILQSKFMLVTLVMATAGWIVAFSGACILKGLHGAWWIIVYEATIVIVCPLTVMADAISHYRLVLLTFLAVSIPLLTIQADYVIQYTQPSIPRDAANAYAVGYVILIIVQYLWVVAFGSSPSSYFGQLVITAQDAPSQHLFPFYGTMATENSKDLDLPVDKRLVLQTPDGEKTIGSSQSFLEKVEALHTYQANPEDPSELSFERGEILEVMDKKGNWWQARKEDGAVGIIPSNYFAPAGNGKGNSCEAVKL